MAEDRERRRLLAVTDHLLDRIEELRLADRVSLPGSLRDQVQAAASQIGVPPGRRAFRTVAAAHSQVFRLQAELLRSSGRAVPLRTRIDSDHGARLSLPARESAQSELEWLERVRLTVQRARDRARYLAAQVETATNSPFATNALIEKRRAQSINAQQALTELRRGARRVTGQWQRLDAPPVLPESGRFELGDLFVELNRPDVLQSGRPVRLTLVERRILIALAASGGRVVSREALQHLATAADPLLDVRSRSLDVHLAHMRDKLGNRYVENVYGIGYRSSSQLAPPTRSSEAEPLQRRLERSEQVRRSVARRSTEVPPPRGTHDGRRSTR